MQDGDAPAVWDDLALAYPDPMLWVLEVGTGIEGLM